MASCTWEDFIARTTTTIRYARGPGTNADPGAIGCGRFDVGQRVLFIADQCGIIDIGYVAAHEQGHAIALAIGLDFPEGGINNQEFAADCLAAIRGYVTGLYWTCPDWALTRTRDKLRNLVAIPDVIPEAL